MPCAAWFRSGPRFNIKMAPYRYRKSHCGDKTISRPSYLHNGISYTGNRTSLYWIGALLPNEKYEYELFIACSIVAEDQQTVIVRRAGLLWSQQDFEWRWSVPLFKCLTVLEFSFILFDLCLLITFFNFIINYVPIVTFWIFTYHKIWILSIMFCFIWSYWIIYFLACFEVSWRVVS